MFFLTLLFLTYIKIDENIINGYREILFCVGEERRRNRHNTVHEGHSMHIK